MRRLQSNLEPIALMVIGGVGAAWCLYRFVELFLSGDLAGKEPVIAFACFSVLAVIGWQELRATGQFNENN